IAGDQGGHILGDKEGGKVTELAAGLYSSYVRTSDSMAYAWGANDRGQLGIMDTGVELANMYNEPKEVPKVSSGMTGLGNVEYNFLNVFAGFRQVAYMDTYGMLWGAGANTEGQLAIGTASDTSEHTLVGDSALRVTIADSYTTQEGDGEMYLGDYQYIGQNSSYGKARYRLWDPTKYPEDAKVDRPSSGYIRDDGYDPYTFLFYGEYVFDRDDKRVVAAGDLTLVEGNTYYLDTTFDVFCMFMKNDARFDYTYGLTLNNNEEKGDGQQDAVAGDTEITVADARTGYQYALFDSEGNRFTDLSQIHVEQTFDDKGTTRTEVLDADDVSDGWFNLIRQGTLTFSLADGTVLDGCKVVWRGHSSYEPNASINKHTETTWLDAIESVENSIIRLDTRDGYSGRNFMQVREPNVSRKTRYVPIVILEKDGPEANKVIYTLDTDDGIYKASYDQNGKAASEAKPADELVMAKVSTGGGHTLNLRADGSVWAYGLNEYGQLGVDSLLVNGPVQGEDDPLEIRVYVPDEDGNYFWDYKTVLSSDGETKRYTAKPVFVDVSAGMDHSLLVDSEGNVWAAGNNDRGQLGLGYVGGSQRHFLKVLDVTTTTALGGAKIVAVSAGNKYSLALASDGRVFAWGDNTYGQLGIHEVGGTVDTPTKLSLSNVNGISAGDSHSLFAMFDGTVYGVGSNDYGKLGQDTDELAVSDNTGIPVFVPDSESVVKVSAGQDHSVALHYNTMVSTWGSNEDGRLGVELEDGSTYVPHLTSLTSISSIVDVDAGADQTLALDYNGLLYSWGNNRNGQLGLGNSANNLWITLPTEHTRYLQDAGTYIRSISAGSGYSALSDTIGQVYGMGDYTKGRYNGDNAITLTQNDTLGDTPVIVGEKGQPSSKHQVLVHVGEDVVVDFMLSKRFNLFTEFWRNYPIQFQNVNVNVAYNNKNDLIAGKEYNTGDGDKYVAKADAVTFDKLVEENRFVVHGASYGMTHIVLRAGDQTVVYYVNVIPVDTETSVNRVAPMMAAGQEFTLALKSDGTVWAWGSNVFGQL
ncbi:MAG: hypothetical protein NC131_21740, partial [Roseburia sp.]|nr:hypothetical protein [Roseburia sp.]